MTAGGWLRRHRVAAGILTLVLVTLTVLSVLTTGGSSRAGALDPDNPSAGGAQAVARVLVSRGVRVDIVRRSAELERAVVGRDTTLVVTSSGNLGRGSARGAARSAARAGAVVLAEPAGALVAALGLPVTQDDEGSGGTAEAGCVDPLLSGLELTVGPSPTYRGRGPAGSAVTACFARPADEEAAPAAWVLRVDRTPLTYVVGATGLLTNERVDRADNAAVALRLLGQHQRLVWYVPDVRDVAAGDTGSLVEQLPRGLFPALGLVAAAVVATVLWRGRRLGPLVVEPLPVVVKAVESTQGRGRLYRRVRDRAHAAAVLREAATQRLATRLRLPATTDTERVVTAVADASGSDPATVRDVLVTRPVLDDTALTRLAADLAALEREVSAR
jgi:hypothetical protein